MENEYNYTEHDITIEGVEYRVTYNLPKDRMTIKPLYDTDDDGNPVPPLHIVAEGFEDFCKDNGYLIMGSRTWSQELDGYDESEWEISLGSLIADWEVKPAIKDFIVTNYKDQLLSNQ